MSPRGSFITYDEEGSPLLLNLLLHMADLTGLKLVLLWSRSCDRSIAKDEEESLQNGTAHTARLTFLSSLARRLPSALRDLQAQQVTLYRHR